MAGLAMRRLDLADALGTAGALVEQPEQLAVDAINIVTNAGQCLLKIITHKNQALRWAKSFMKSTNA